MVGTVRAPSGGVGAVAALALLYSLIVAAPAGAQTAPPERSSAWSVERVSVGPNGEQANADSWEIAVDAAGDRVAFTTSASNLGTDGQGQGGDILVKDLATGAQQVADVTSDGGHLEWSNAPQMSADGTVVVFQSGYWNAARAYRRDLVTGTTEQLPSSKPSAKATVGADGRRTSYVQLDDYYYDNDDRTYIHVHDAETGKTRRITNQPAPYRYVSQAVISGDGRTVVYTEAGGWNHDRYGELYVQDITDLDAPGAPQLVGLDRITSYAEPAISHDGRYVAYGRWPDVRLIDRQAGSDEPILTVGDNGDIYQLAMSADGSMIAAVLSDYGADAAHLWVHHRDTGRDEYVGDIGEYGDIDMSADGQTIGIGAYAEDLVEGDTNGLQDAFVARRADVEAPAFPDGATLRADEVGTTLARLSWDAAGDDTAVTRYEVSVDGAVVGTTDGATTYTVTGLSAGRTYTMAVRAGDAAGRWSTPLEAQVATVATAEPGDAALLATDLGSGRIRLVWDPAADATGYRVWRAVGDGDAEPIADVGGDVTTYDDSGRDAETTYHYVVSALRPGRVDPHTRPASVTTGPLTVSDVTWAGRPVLGTDVDVTVTAAPGWQGLVEVAHTSWFDEDGSELAQPRSVVATLPAAETSPGTYTATFPIVEGVAELTSITGGVVDGGGHRAVLTAARLPQPVTGAVRVEVVAPDGTLPGGRLIAAGVGTTRQAPLTGGTVATLAPLPAGNVVVTVLSSEGRELARHDGLALRAGRTEAVTLTPALPAALEVLVRDPQGHPMRDADVVLHGPTPGHSRTTSSGQASFGGRLEDEAYRVEVNLPAFMRIARPAPVDITLQRGFNRVVVDLVALELGALVGTVTDYDGQPAPGATVVVSQTIDDRPWSASAETDADGRYRVEALAGPAQVTVSYRHDPPSDVGTVTLGGADATLDVTLTEPAAYDLYINLYTQYGTAPEQAMPIDWRVAVHTGLRVTTPAGVLNPRSNVVSVTGRPGDQVQVCADGREGHLSAACTSLTLGDAKRVSAELHLRQAAVVRGRVVSADGGSAHRNGYWPVVRLQRVDSDGRYGRDASAAVATDGTFSIGAAEAGTYDIEAVIYTPNGHRGFGRRLQRTLADGEELDLGDIVMVDNPWVERSHVTLAQREVLPGGTATVRVAAHPGAAQVTGGRVRVGIPAGTSPAPDGVTVDGAPVPLEVGSGAVLVPLPDRTFATGDPGYIVTVALRLDGAAPGAQLRVPVSVAATLDGTARTDLVGSTTVRVAGVSLQAPSTRATHDVALSGRGPAGADVSIFDGARMVGRTTATPGGVWRLLVTLPDLGDGHEHVLRAEAVFEGATLVSRVRTVVVDTRYPELQRAVVRQDDGRAVPIDPMYGVARFPYVFNFQPLVVDLQFAGRGTVEDVRTRVGTTSAAATQVGERSWTGRVHVSGQGLGPVSASYERVPEQVGLDDQPKPDEPAVRDRLPAVVADYTDPQTSSSEDAATRTRTGTVTTRLPSVGPDGRMTASMSVQRGVSYTPSTKDLKLARRAGVAMYGVTSSVQLTSDGLRIDISGYVPEDELGEDPAELQERLLVGAAQQRDTADSAGIVAAAPVAAARVGFGIAFNGAQNVDSLYTALTTGEKYDKLNRLLDYVGANCSSSVSSYYTNRLNLLNQSALATDASHASLMVLGLLLAPETLGVGTLVVWGITFAADKALDANMDSDIEDLTAEMLGDEECKNDDDDDDDPRDPDEPDDPDRPDDDDLADPVWIHDPSGYVYEAVASNRVKGVRATLRSGATEAGPWTTWDADWFGQTNPLVTDADGRYGWDVPEGWWQVDYSKEGYEPASSAVLRVLPPHFDVNVGLVSYAAPQVASVVATGEDASAIDVEFDRYMRLDAADAITASDGDGAPVAGDVVALDGEVSPAGPTYARRFRLVPSVPLEPGSTVEVTVDEAASSYADRPMTGRVRRNVEVVDPTPPPPVHEPLTTSKAASAPSVGAGGTVGYTITIANPNDVAIPLATVSDTLPEGFAVVSGSTTGITSADPTVDGRTLSWPVDVAVPPGGTVELGFTATASRTAGAYPNEAGGSAVGADVTATGPTAVVTVERLATALTAEPVLASLGGTPRVTAGTLSATLTSGGAPVPGQVIRFMVGGAEACTAMTDAAGRAVCGSAMDTVGAAAAQGYRAEFAGDGTYAPASADGAVIAAPGGRSSMP